MQSSLAQNLYTPAKSKKNTEAERNDLDCVAVLSKLKRELDCLHNSFDTITDPILIDSNIYEIMSVNMKYKFYLKLCKERGLV